jgi:DNA repair exonuclease SbcCD ATPase subunit/DNA repair exonuclease SbcCD nuclease subunit
MTHKIAHIADIHFRGYKRHSEYRQIMQQFFDICRDRQVDCFVIAGDIVHSKTQNITPELIEILTWWFNEMSSIAPVHVTLGNHDGLLTNLSRQDTVTPVIRAINSDRIFLYKDSGVYPILGGDCDLVVFSPFDEDKWPLVKEEALNREFSIATFHGAVNGCKTDSEWSLGSSTDVSFFSEYDFAMLGDIHKRQDLDFKGRVSYPGSMIQQNFGEIREKGFLLWEIDDKYNWKKEFIQLDPVCPYITLDWQGDLALSISNSGYNDDSLKNARVRIKSETPLSQVETREVAKNLRKAFETHEVYFKHEVARHKTNIDAEDSVLSVKRDPDSLVKMIVDYGYVDPSKKAVLEKMRGAISRFSKDIQTLNETGGKTWSLGRMSWDNTYGYGENNWVNFSSMNGLVGIFGQNRVGKSSIPATVLYSLFNKSDRGLNKNVDIVNVRKDYCNSKVSFHVGADDFVAERQTIKKVNKKEDVLAATHLNLFKTNSAGEVLEDMNGEQRRDTDTMLQDLLGNIDDFTLVGYATQGGGNNFIDTKPTKRKEIIARFLQLDFFSELYDKFRDASSGTRRSMADAQEKILKANPSALASEIRELKKERESARDQLVKARQELNSMLEQFDPDVKLLHEARERREELISSLASSDVKIKDVENLLKDLESKKHRANITKKMNEESRLEIDTNALQDSLDSYVEISSSRDKMLATVENKKLRYDSLKKSVSLLKKVPCGDQFPTCRFIKDSHSSKSLMPTAAEELKEARSSAKALEKALKAINIEEVKKELKKAKQLDENSVEIEKKLLNITSKVDQAQRELSDLHGKKSRIKDELTLLEARWDFNSSEKEVTDDVQPLKDMITSLEKREQKCSENIGSKTQQLMQLKELSETVTSMKDEHEAYEVLMKAFSKSGIPSHLVTATLPIINKRLEESLFEDCGFRIELESEESSKKLDMYIDYGDSKRKIECASGMEKMIASLALRTALHSITHLPKPDFMILDEGFGALDDSNVEVCMKMLRSMLSHFRFILVISHVETVKEAVDEMIEVSRVGLDSKVQHG